MKVQYVRNQQYNNSYYSDKQQPSFGNFANMGSALTTGFSQFLRFLDTNQAWGATAVDFSCMVAPRTITDFGRGVDAGTETLRREASGTVNHAFVGLVYGPLAGMLVATALNGKYGIKAHKIFADSDAINVLSKIQYDSIVKNNGVTNLSDYASNVASSISDKNGKHLSSKAQEDFAKTLMKEVTTSSDDNSSMLRNIVLSDLGSESDIILKTDDKHIKASLGDIIDNVTTMSRTLFKDKVVNSFKEATSFADVKFVKELKQVGLKRSIVGLAIASAIGCATQPINVYLTKKKTGSDGFVGVEGREKDTSFKFKLKKVLTATAFGAGVYALMDKPFLKGIQYKGITPTLNQFKLVYGLTIMSRFLATRDSNELRESTVKDTLGFLSWLVLGNFVQKGTTKLLSNLYKRKNGIDLKLIGRTRDEVLYSALKKAGISTVKDGKALSFKELLKLLPKADKITKTKLRYLNIAQLAGYVFSGTVLGFGIPKLNIYMTKKSEEKRKALLAQQQSPASNMLKPENIAFLNNFTSSQFFNN